MSEFPQIIEFNTIPEKYRECPFCEEPLVILAIDYSELCPTEFRHFIFRYGCGTQVRAEEECDFSDEEHIERSESCIKEVE